MVQPAVKRHKRGAAWNGASGMKPPTFPVNRGDHHELVQGDIGNPRDVHPIDQLVIVDDSGEQYVRLFPEMTVDALRRKIEALRIAPAHRIILHADEATKLKYFALWKELHPAATIQEGEATEPGTHLVEGRAVFTYHADYWRAIAKIGFHYYLLNSQRELRGDEPEFAEIRRFILAGGDAEPFFARPMATFVLRAGFAFFDSAGDIRCHAESLSSDDRCSRMRPGSRIHSLPRIKPFSQAVKNESSTLDSN